MPTRKNFVILRRSAKNEKLGFVGVIYTVGRGLDPAAGLPVN